MIMYIFRKFFCYRCGEPGPCDQHCQGCGCDVFMPEVESYQITRWDPELRERVDLVMLCPECCKGDRSLIDYFDKDGRQINLDGKPLAARMPTEDKP